MDAYRVDVLHAADGDDVASAVPHDFKLNLFPACDTAFDEDFMDTGQLQTTVANFPQHELVIGNAAAGAAQGVGGTDDDGQADGVGELHGVLHGMHDLGDNAGLVDGLHGVLEALAILCPADGVGGGAQELDAVAVQGAVLVQVHGQVQADLTAQGGQNCIGMLFFDDLGERITIQRLDIHVVGDILVGHDGGRVGVDQHHLDALFLQGAAGLGACVVELGGLADDDGAGADDQYFFDVGILRHDGCLPSSPERSYP